MELNRKKERNNLMVGTGLSIAFLGLAMGLEAPTAYFFGGIAVTSAFVTLWKYILSH